jgi:hypothetical protein
VLDLRKKSDEEYAQDTRNQLSDTHGKQLSIEEAVEDGEMKPVESRMEPEVSEEPEASDAIQKARSTARDGKGKQLALEEVLGDD